MGENRRECERMGENVREWNIWKGWRLTSNATFGDIACARHSQSETLSLLSLGQMSHFATLDLD